MGQVSNKGTQSAFGADIDVTVGDTRATSPVSENSAGRKRTGRSFLLAR